SGFKRARRNRWNDCQRRKPWRCSWLKPIGLLPAKLVWKCSLDGLLILRRPLGWIASFSESTATPASSSRGVCLQPEESLRAVEALEALPLGACLATRVIGRCMSPLISSGDVLVVRRATVDSVRPGEIAIVRTADGRFLAHLVAGVRPLRTATLRGKLD